MTQNSPRKIIYTTKQGDEWDKIAFDQLGSEHLVDRLITANSEYQNVVVFAAGIKLKIPQVEISAQIFGPAPWRRVSSVPGAFHAS